MFFFRDQFAIPYLRPSLPENLLALNVRARLYLQRSIRSLIVLVFSKKVVESS